MRPIHHYLIASAGSRRLAATQQAPQFSATSAIAFAPFLGGGSITLPHGRGTAILKAPSSLSQLEQTGVVMALAGFAHRNMTVAVTGNRVPLPNLANANPSASYAAIEFNSFKVGRPGAVSLHQVGHVGPHGETFVEVGGKLVPATSSASAESSAIRHGLRSLASHMVTAQIEGSFNTRLQVFEVTGLGFHSGSARGASWPGA